MQYAHWFRVHICEAIAVLILFQCFNEPEKFQNVNLKKIMDLFLFITNCHDHFIFFIYALI